MKNVLEKDIRARARVQRNSVLVENTNGITPTGTQWTEKRGQEQFPDAKSLLSGDHVHYVGSNELWISWKKFVLLAYFCRDIWFLRHFLVKRRGLPQVYLKNQLSNFDLKLCAEVGPNETSLLLKFQIFGFFLSRDTSIRKNTLFHITTSLIAQNVKCSYLRIGATKKFETFRIN